MIIHIKDIKGFGGGGGVRKRINTTVKSIYESPILVERTGSIHLY